MSIGMLAYLRVAPRPFDGTYPLPAERSVRIGDPVKVANAEDALIVPGCPPGWEWTEPAPGRRGFLTRPAPPTA